MNNKSNSNFSLRKLLLTALVAGPLATLPAPLWALPGTGSSNLTLTSGVSVATSGTNVLNVTATADKQVLSWVEFGGSSTNTIANGDVINYFLPSSTSSILNLVTATTGATTINGTLASNGNVFVLNPNGITIGATAQINTANFVASTVPDSLAAFSFAQGGTISFSGTPTQALTVLNGASFQSVGAGNNIKLYGKGVDIQGGSFFGNLTVTTYGGNATLASGTTGTTPVTVGTITGGGGNLTVVTGGSSIAAGNVVLGSTNTSATLTVAGNTSIDMTGTTNGSLTGPANTTTVNYLVANTSGTRVTINAGTGTSAGSVTLPTTENVKIAGLAVNANNVTVTATGADITLGASSVAGNFTLTNTGNAIASSGNISVGGNVALNAGSITSFTGVGNLTFTTLTTTTTGTISTTGDLTVTAVNPVTVKNLSLTTTGGNITANALSASSTLTLRASGDIVVTTLDTGTLSVTSTGGKITATTVNNTATGTLQSVGDITTGNWTRSNNNGLTVTSSAGNVTLGNITTTNNGGIAVSTTNGNITIGTVSTTQTGALTLTSASGNITAGNITNTGTGAITLTATTGSVTLGTISSSTTNAVSVVSGATFTNASTITVPVFNVTSTTGNITLSGVVSSSTTTLNAFGDITATNTSNDFSQGSNNSSTFRSLTLIGGGGGTNGINIVDANDIIIGGATATKGATAITAAGYIAIGKPATDISANVVNGTDSLFFGGNLTLNSTATSLITNKANSLSAVTGTINSFANNITVLGTVSLTTSGNNNAILGTPGLGANTLYSFGPITASLGTGKLSVTENTTLNLGTITAAEVYATSVNGDIINKGGILTVTGGAGLVTVAAGSIFSPGNVTLDNTSNTYTKVVAANVNNLTVAGANGYTLQAGGGFTLGGLAIDGKSVGGVADITAASGVTVNAVTGTGGDYNLVAPHSSGSGSVVITDPNSVTLQNATNSGSGSLTVNAAGVITLGSGIALTSSGTTTFNAVGTNASIVDSASNISITGPTVFNSDNDINISKTGHSLGPVSLTTTGGTNLGSLLVTTDAGGNVTAVSLPGGAAQFGSGYLPSQAALPIFITGVGGTTATATAATNAAGQITAVTLVNGATGTYTASQTNASATATVQTAANYTTYSTGVTNTNKTTNITYTEGATANLNVVKVNSNGSGANGNLNVTSTTGDIIQTATTGTIIVPFSSSNANPSNTVSFTAAGGVKVGNGGAGTNSIAAPVSLTGGADSLLTNASGTAITLNGVKVLGGSLKVETAAANISEATGTTVFIFGQSAFKTTGTGKITVANTGNNFGAISILSGTGDVSIKENGTMNLASVASTGSGGKFTAVSETAGIIQTANSYTGFTAGIVPQGATSLTAAAAGIALNSNTNDFKQQSLTLTTTGGGNVSITDSNGTLTLLGTGSNVSGTLTIRNVGNGTLSDGSAGNLTVTGAVLFDTGSGAISITGTGNSFGPLQFRGGSAGKSIVIAEANTLNLAAGSVANGPVILSSNANIITSGIGLSSFVSGNVTPSLSLAAGGSITITNPIFVQNGLSFQALGTVDLSSLSLLGNLNNIAPTNLGAGSYKAPAP